MTAVELDEDRQPWSRLDRRMLLVHPVDEFVRFIPVLVGSLIFGSSSGNHVFSTLVLTLIVGFGVLRWFTTTYRIGPQRLELRTGLFERKRQSIPRDRVRSVDIEANLLHRVLGLAVVHVDTGKHGKSDRFILNALDARLAPQLRATLLAHTTHADESLAPVTAPRQAGREISHWRAFWVRYAPLSLTGFALVGTVFGVAAKYGLTDRILRADQPRANSSDGTIVVLVVCGVIGLAVAASLAACAQYLMTYYGFQVVDDGKTLQITHGLFTTRQVTLDRSRLRGATLNESALMRAVGGAQLRAIMTGAIRHPTVLPQAPRPEAERVMRELFGDDVGATVELTRHGPAARRRRYIRAVGPVLVAAVVLTVVTATVNDVPWWPWVGLMALFGGAVALAADRYRGLGHAVLCSDDTGHTRWLITRHGCLNRARDCLAAAGIIGWTVRQSFFQRRAGVATVIAATAAGKRRYRVVDLPIDQAWALIELVTPGMSGRPAKVGPAD